MDERHNHSEEPDMQTADEAIEIVFVALRSVAPPLGMERRILEKCGSWRSCRCRSPSVDQIRDD
jgi:hypothetical protein